MVLISLVAQADFDPDKQYHTASTTPVRFDTLPILFGEFLRNICVNLNVEPTYNDSDVTTRITNCKLFDPKTSQWIQKSHDYRLTSIPDHLLLIASE